MFKDGKSFTKRDQSKQKMPFARVLDTLSKSWMVQLPNAGMVHLPNAGMVHLPNNLGNFFCKCWSIITAAMLPLPVAMLTCWVCG
jgi:hypothetical protein